MSEPAKPRTRRNTRSWKSECERLEAALREGDTLLQQAHTALKRSDSDIRQLQLEAREQRQRGYREAVLALTAHLERPATGPWGKYPPMMTERTGAAASNESETDAS